MHPTIIYVWKDGKQIKNIKTQLSFLPAIDSVFYADKTRLIVTSSICDVDNKPIPGIVVHANVKA